MCAGALRKWEQGPVAQLGERLVCIQEVVGSIPVGSTTICQGGFKSESVSDREHARACDTWRANRTESTKSIAARRAPSRKRGVNMVPGYQTEGL